MERRSTLRQSKFFECDCARCADPTECGTYLSAFKCQKCSVGNVLPLKPLQQHTNWRCDRCSYRLNAAVVARIDNQLRNEFDAIGSNDVQLYLVFFFFLFFFFLFFFLVVPIPSRWIDFFFFLLNSVSLASRILSRGTLRCSTPTTTTSPAPNIR